MTTSLTPEITEKAPAKLAGRSEFPRAAPAPAAPAPDAGAPGATAPDLTGVHTTAPDTNTDTGESGSQLHRLAAMASLQEWIRRSSPVLMHEAVLAGESPAEVAAAARLSVAQAHLTWNTWATRRLASPTPGEALPLRRYLRVHTAFARALNDA
ncbi:hypothetical protein [Amycolatopsis sp. DSM 110486]|uniref:hypothetical protein n=1 Tax=Amycolatopsis sp. DSM 110486 TaxID=2865832 RepID=UPI001C69702B|nr:hypothetical protein [Amycolatopsis sp. DSM 110486]QYN18172.1 hypothetical protein K1T34_36260 [Amycolatopsis sp. DSM 110486]